MAIHGLTHSFDVIREVDRKPKSLVLVIDTDQGERRECFPRSQIALYPFDRDGKTTWKVQVPDWLVQKKGLVA